MSQTLHPPRPVKLMVGMLCQSKELLARARELMAVEWGEVDIVSETMPFTFTKYYEQEMGVDLLRQFVSFEALIDPGQLGPIKHRANAMEAQLAELPEGQALAVVRPINLDPGYIEPSKLVLASTKNFSHRIYIGDNIYAEPTLHYKRGHWYGWPFSFPDYSSGQYDPFLNQARNRLVEQLSSKS